MKRTNCAVLAPCEDKPYNRLSVPSTCLLTTILVMLSLALSVNSFAGKKKLHKKMDAWLGHSKHELIMAWGMPSAQSDDGNNGQIIAYAYAHHSDGVNWGYGNYTAPQSWYNYRIFYVNAEGKIYSWRSERKNIPPQQVDLRIYRY